MEERPILFSGPMVTAILEGRKSQTRRVMKPQPSKAVNFPVVGRYFQKPCPYGQVGSKLWVKETWAVHSAFPIRTEGNYLEIKYRASVWGEPRSLDYSLTWDVYDKYAQKKYRLWQPSIFMPRFASRITLKITGVRVERLQEISEGDAQAEGVERLALSPDTLPDVPPPSNRVHPMTSTYVEAYQKLWNSINGNFKRWEFNPWVWVIEFKKVEVK